MIHPGRGFDAEKTAVYEGDGSVWAVLFRCHNACGLISQNLRITDEKR